MLGLCLVAEYCQVGGNASSCLPCGVLSVLFGGGVMTSCPCKYDGLPKGMCWSWLVEWGGSESMWDGVRYLAPLALGKAGSPWLGCG